MSKSHSEPSKPAAPTPPKLGNNARFLRASVKKRLVSSVEKQFIPFALAEIAKQKPYLSDQNILARQKQKLRTVFDAIVRDYSTG